MNKLATTIVTVLIVCFLIVLGGFAGFKFYKSSEINKVKESPKEVLEYTEKRIETFDFDNYNVNVIASESLDGKEVDYYLLTVQGRNMNAPFDEKIVDIDMVFVNEDGEEEKLFGYVQEGSLYLNGDQDGQELTKDTFARSGFDFNVKGTLEVLPFFNFPEEWIEERSAHDVDEDKNYTVAFSSIDTPELLEHVVNALNVVYKDIKVEDLESAKVSYDVSKKADIITMVVDGHYKDGRILNLSFTVEDLDVD